MSPGRETNTAKSVPLLGPSMVQTFPEVLNAVRFKPPILSWMVGYQDKMFNETGFVFADASVFEVFSLPLVQGDGATALQEPYTIVISETMAKKYFGSEDPMGKVLSADHRPVGFRVTGVMRDMPANSHARFDFLPSHNSLEEIYGEQYVTSMQSLDFYTYVLLREDASAEALERKFPDFIGPLYSGEFESAEEARSRVTMRLQPLTGIHLNSHLDDEIGPNSDMVYIYVFSAIAFIILLIACINFMNLATAYSANRAKEVGLRKVVGAYRRQLIHQFLGESVLLSCLALLMTVLLVYITLPTFNALTGKTLSLGVDDNGFIWLGMVGIVLFVGLLSGSYPALFLSAFQPIDVLKGSLKSGSKNARLRTSLVVVQFSFSVFFIIGTMIVSEQLDYVRNRRLGFDKERMVVVPLSDGDVARKYPSMGETLLQSGNVLSTTFSSNIPGGRGRVEINKAIVLQKKNLICSLMMRIYE